MEESHSAWCATIGSVRPAYYAYKVVTHLFAGVSDGKYVPNSASGVYTVILNRPDLQITVAWNQRPTPRTTIIPALGSSAYLVSKLGDVQTTDAAQWLLHVYSGRCN